MANYWGFEAVYKQIKNLLNLNPSMTRREALKQCTTRRAWCRTNPPRKRFQGTQERLRRQLQIEKGFKQVRL
jgi:hypothetical protein